jgi:hypothetical protein
LSSLEVDYSFYLYLILHNWAKVCLVVRELCPNIINYVRGFCSIVYTQSYWLDFRWVKGDLDFIAIVYMGCQRDVRVRISARHCPYEVGFVPRSVERKVKASVTLNNFCFWRRVAGDVFTQADHIAHYWASRVWTCERIVIILALFKNEESTLLMELTKFEEICMLLHDF